MKRTTALALVAALALAPAALADRKEVQYYPDGSVIADGHYHDSVIEWQRSDQFQTGGYRCASEEGLDLEMLRMLADPNDCTFNNTTIDPEYEAATGITYRIPTVIHVIMTTGGTGNLPQPLVESQIDVLNEDFQAIVGTNGENGYNTKFEFVLVDEEPDGTPSTGVYYHTNNTWFADPGPGQPNPMKQALAWDTTRYLNVYSNDAAGNLGYATFPQTSAGTINDGIVLLYQTVGFENPQGGVYDLGRSGTHEVGHWVGLLHTFQSGCGTSSSPGCYTSGDLICDTPSQQSPQFGCPTAQTSCGGLISDFANYMNYTDDLCMEQFTQEQSNRARCSFVNYRPEMLVEVLFEDSFESGDLSAWSASEG
jgi:hypothetical protein